jgi:prevent-host-death family protein
MQKVTVSRLKNELSAYLRKVRAGATVLILDRDEPIARLVPLGNDPEATPEDDRLARLEARGLIRRGTGRVEIPPPLPGGEGRGLVEALLADRAEARY